MPVELSVEGSHDLERVARRLKRAAAGELRKELYRGINRAVKPMKQAAKDAADRELPQRGGLNKFVASSKFGTRTRGFGRSPGVSITAKKSGHDLRSLDRGRLRHPLFGNRRFWYQQPVRAGWWTQTLNDEAPLVRRELIRVLDDVAARIGRG